MRKIVILFTTVLCLFSSTVCYAETIEYTVDDFSMTFSIDETPFDMIYYDGVATWLSQGDAFEDTFNEYKDELAELYINEGTVMAASKRGEYVALSVAVIESDYAMSVYDNLLYEESEQLASMSTPEYYDWLANEGFDTDTVELNLTTIGDARYITTKGFRDDSYTISYTTMKSGKGIFISLFTSTAANLDEFTPQLLDVVQSITYDSSAQPDVATGRTSATGMTESQLESFEVGVAIGKVLSYCFIAGIIYFIYKKKQKKKSK